MWIFAYGSLMCKAHFEYEQKLIGKVKGYSRRFYQISLYGRGTTTNPGRVLTLIPEKHGAVWGVAYRLTERSYNKIITKLNSYDIDGYQKTYVTFIPKKSDSAPVLFTKDEMLKRLKVNSNVVPKERTKIDQESLPEAKPGIHKPFSRPDLKNFNPGQHGGVNRNSSISEDDASYLDDARRSTIDLSIFRSSTNDFDAPRISKLLQSRESKTDNPRRSSFSPYNFDVKKYSQANLQKDELLDGGIQALTFIGTSENMFYSYETDEDVIAEQISTASGVYGTNTDYVLQIAQTLRKILPSIDDDHLFTIEHKLRDIKKRGWQRRHDNNQYGIVVNDNLAQKLNVDLSKIDDLEK